MKTYKDICSKLDSLSHDLYAIVHDLADKNTDGLPLLSLAAESLRSCVFTIDAAHDSLENLEG